MREQLRIRMRPLVVILALVLSVGRAQPAAAVVDPLADVAVSAYAVPGGYGVSQDVAPGETLTITITVSNR
ncbi:MAG TPA: hypothetical protein VNB51_06025, partial [Candidatus Udaeobacter sp.]|nr:hypothetical protein [Candidatus Udaeobacter sp.]